MQALINTAEGRWRVDTQASNAPGFVPEPIPAAGELTARQVEREAFAAQVRTAQRLALAEFAERQAARLAQQARDKQAAATRKRNERARLLRDLLSAAITITLLSMCLMAADLPAVAR